MLSLAVGKIVMHSNLLLLILRARIEPILLLSFGVDLVKCVHRSRSARSGEYLQQAWRVQTVILRLNFTHVNSDYGCSSFFENKQTSLV